MKVFRIYSNNKQQLPQWQPIQSVCFGIWLFVWTYVNIYSCFCQIRYPRSHTLWVVLSTQPITHSVPVMVPALYFALHKIYGNNNMRNHFIQCDINWIAADADAALHEFIPTWNCTGMKRIHNETMYNAIFHQC